MYVFSSLEAARKAGFQWYCFSKDYQLHVVEMDRQGRHGHREKALAFARPTQEDTERAA